MKDRNNRTRQNDATANDRWRALAARCPGMTAQRVTLSAPLHNTLFALFLASILAYGAGFAWYLLAKLDLIDLLRWENNIDDSFYYFQIAYNLAEGKFSTFDGGITQTNGYHTEGKRWEEKVFRREVRRDGRTIVVWGV